MGIYEPHSVRQQCGSTIDDKGAREKFIKTWQKKAETRAKGWLENRDSQSKHPLLLHWIAEITEYLIATGNKIRSSQGADLSVALDPRWPIIGPNFEPPEYLHHTLREVNPQVEPDVAYLKPCYVVHWIFHEALRHCPKCHSKRLERNGWNPSGPREVHGLFREEMAIGIQLRCLDCAAKYRKEGTEHGEPDGRYCWTTTSAKFWENFEHWELPIGLPHFLPKSAVSSELFDFIIEMRLKSTSAGLAENVKQLHLLEYHRQHLRYLQAYRARSQKMSLSKQKALVPFSKLLTKRVGKQTSGYDNRSISDDLITTILLEFCNKTRIEESEEHMRTLSAVAISVDTTFRCAFKATLVDKNKARVRSHNGGFVSVLNQKSQPISWRLCHSQSQVETQEMLSGLSSRLVCLGLPPPEILTADNCCQVRNSTQKVFPNIDVVQDVWHFLMRYLVCVKDGTKNPYRSEVANDIVGAILKVKAANGVSAIYRPQPEQEERLAEVYNKWNEHGGVWSAAAAKVHITQLTHVQKGCLARSRNDIPTDGSRIEGSHKGWNSIMRAFPSGLEVMNALGHDHVLRRNVRLDMQDEKLDQSKFMYHTHGSHHVRLTNACMKLWNALVEGQKRSGPLPADIHTLPELRPVDSRERFGLVEMSAETATQYALTAIKQEPGDEVLDLSSQEMLDADRVLEEIGVDPALLNAPISEPGPGADIKGKGVKRTREDEPQDDDEIVELSPSEWGVPKEWFPAPLSGPAASQAAISSTSIRSSSSKAGMVSGAATIAISSSSAVLPLCDHLTTTPSGASADPALRTFTIPASSLPSTTTPSTFVIPPSSAHIGEASSGTPGLGAAMTPALPETPGAPPTSDGTSQSRESTILQSSTNMFSMLSGNLEMDSEVRSRPPSRKSSIDLPPPRKKACLTVPGMPPPLKSRLSSSRQGASSKPSCKQRNRSQNNRGTLDTMFKQASTATASHAPALALTPTNEPCLPGAAIVGLTRSQRLFSVVTQVDHRALTFGKSASSREFFLFMRLRATHQWTTFQMSPYDWVCAASTYNTAIKDINREQGLTLPLKTPRALLDKLSEIETQIFTRIRDNHYRSRSGRTDFWEHHCKAVYLGSKIQRMVDDASFKMGKNHICGRCKRIMYPEGKNHKDNHSHKICSDGVRQTPEKVHLVINGVSRDFIEHPPAFPQPKDVFTDGDVFHPVRFMEVVRAFYDRIVINHSAPGALAMNDYAFAALLYERTAIVPGLDGRPSKVIFKLFHSFKLAPGEAVVLDEHEGETYLRMDCLSEPSLEVLQDAAVDGLGLTGSA